MRTQAREVYGSVPKRRNWAPRVALAALVAVTLGVLLGVLCR